MKKYILLAVLLIPTTTFAITLTGPLTSSQTWTAASGPYEVDNITVPAGVSLSIEPGTNIVPTTQRLVGSAQVFNVLGTLNIGSLSGLETSIIPNYAPAPPMPEGLTPLQQISYILSASSNPITSLFKIGQNAVLNIYNTKITQLSTVLENSGGTVVANKLTSQNNNLNLRQTSGNTTILNSVLPTVGFTSIEATGGTLSVHNSTLPGQVSFFGSPYQISTSANLNNNWWGSASGPDTSVFTDQSNITYAPWLSSPPVIATSTPVCTLNCNSNIVFIPGLMGSRLYDRYPDTALCNEEGTSGYCVDKKWLPLTDSDIRDLYLKSDGTSVNSNIVTKEVVDSALGIKPLYQSLLNDMASWKTSGLIQDATSTPYDWRLSIDDVVNKGVKVGNGYISYDQTPANGENPYIIDTIIKSASSSHTGKVTLVAHSNGGLVAKAIMQKLRSMGNENIVDNLVLVASPQLGTPDAGASLLHGSCLGQVKYEDFKLGCATSDPAETRAIAQNMPSAYNLLPSNEFFNTQFVSDISPLAFYGPANSTNATQYGTEVKDAALYRQYLKGTDTRLVPAFSDVDSPAVVNAYLLNQAVAMHDSLDTWRPASTTKVTEIAGFGVYTIAGLNYVSVRECDTNFAGTCVPKFVRSVNDQLTINGDETVVSPSAHHLSSKTADADRWFINLQGTTYTHKDILEVPDLRNFIKNTLTHATSTYIRLTNSQTPPSTNLEYYRVRVHSPLNINLYDTFGNHTGLNASGTLETNIPGSQYFSIGTVKTIIAPKANLQKVELGSYASGSFTLDQQTLVGDMVTNSSQVQAIPSATSTLVTIPLNQPNITQSPIQIDFDGNQTIDTVVTPSATSTIVYDVTPPELQLTFSTTTKDVILSGLDNIDQNPTLILGTSTISIRDSQNNITVISFKKLKDNPTKLVLVYNTISRNGVSTTTPNTRIEYDWELDNQGNLKDLDTKVFIKGIERNTFNYKKSNNTIIIKTKNLQTGQITTITRTEFVPVTVITNQDNLLDINY